MRALRFACLVLAAVFGVVGMSASAVPAQPKIPADFTFDQGKDSPGKVTFRHGGAHKEKIEKCTACHTKVFKMKRGQTGPLSMAKMKAGEQCGACHDGKTEVAGKVVFATEDKAACATCHKKE